MELKLSDKTLRKILIGVAVVAVLILIINGVYRRSKYAYPPPASSTDLNDTTLTSQLTACQTAYSTSVAAGTATATAQTTLQTCVSTSVSAYVTNKCPYTNGVQPAATAGATVTAAWATYQTDIGSIRTAYANLIGSTNTASTAAMITAARKADLTGATRRYLATVCPATSGPGFYTASDYGLTPTTTNGVTTYAVTSPPPSYPDPISTTYAAWRTYTAAPPAGTVYGFSATAVTDASVQAWAVGAGVWTGTDTTVTPTSALAASGSKYSGVSTAGIPNWVVARDFGPGSIGTSVPVSYAGDPPSTSAATPLVKKANITLPYTYA
jgi:hypothetical protein